MTPTLTSRCSRPGPRAELLAARDPAGPAAAAGPAHYRLVGHPEPAHRQLAGELADPPLDLRDGELPPAGLSGQHTCALTAFAAATARSGHAAGPVRLADPAFASPLLVHMHALLTVCGAQVPTTGDAVRERILDAVLDRERDRWAATFPAGVPTGGAGPASRLSP